MQRSTRSLSLTEHGTTLLAHAKLLTDDLEEARNAMVAVSGDIRGVLKIAAPAPFTRNFLGPYLHEFLSKYKGIGVDIEATSRDIDLIEEGFDLHFRMGMPNQNSVVAKVAAKPRRLLCGSPSLLKTRIATPSDLTGVPFVTTQPRKNKNPFVLRQGKKEYVHDPQVRVTCTDPTAVAELIVSGIGVGLVPEYYAREHIRAKRLMVLLPDWQTDICNPLVVVYPSRKGLDPKVRSFLDWFSERIAPMISGE
jgi:LysR family transcriptional regulator AphB